MKPDCSYFKSSRFFKEMLMIIAGLAVGAAAVYYFLLPGKYVIGCLSGLCLVISELLSGIGITLKVSTLLLILNAVLLILAYVTLGAEVGFKTVISALLLGPFMDLWAWIMPYESLIEPGRTTVMGDPIFDILAYCLLLGASQAFLFRINASTGGLDIIAMIMKKYLHIEIGTAVAVSGIAVCLLGFLINPFRVVVIGIIATWFNGLVVDFFTTSLNKRKRICIVTPDYDEIREYIVHDLGRGCSLYDATGGYTGEKHVEIQSILTQNEFANLMEHIREKNYNTFITAGTCNEVYGLWLKPKKHKH